MWRRQRQCISYLSLNIPFKEAVCSVPTNQMGTYYTCCWKRQRSSFCPNISSHQIGVFTSIIRHKGITVALTILESREVLFDGYPVYSDVQVVSTGTVIQGHLHQTSPKPLNLQTAGDGRAGARVVTADACW